MILDIYFARRFLRSFLLIGGVFMCLIVLVDLIEQLRKFDDVDVTFGQVLWLVFLNSPTSISEILPLLMILSIIVQFTAMARSSELVVTRAAGRSGIRALAAPVAVALGIGLFAVSTLNPIVAATSKRYQQLADIYRTGAPAALSLSGEGLWLRQGSVRGQSVIHADGISPEGQVLYDVTILTYAKDSGPTRRIEATSARLENGEWLLSDAKVWPLIAGLNPESNSAFHETLRIPSSLTQERIRESLGRPAGLSIWSIPSTIRALEQAGFSTRRYEVWYQVELARPLFLVSMVLVGAAFTMRHTRFGGTGLSVLTAVLLGFALYFVRNFAEILGKRADAGGPRSLGTAVRVDHAVARPAVACGGRMKIWFSIRIAAARFFLLLLAMAASEAAAQSDPETGIEPPALLVADSIFISADRQLVAEGNVEVLQGDTHLRAQRITFDGDDGKLTIEGPIRIDRGQGEVILASAAELSEGLQNGLLTGARLVLDRQLQLASVQMTRVGGRYTQLDKATVTSCKICDDGKPPLWQIRARRVIHDQQEKQIYFEDAQFRVLDIPVFYFPRIRLPDPTLKRANGFLIPDIRTTSQLGTGIRVPYFFKLGDSADLTLSPYLSPNTTTLDYRYRQAFRTGRMAFEGAFTRDDLQPGEDRGYLFGDGYFQLQRDFNLDFQVQTTSDKAYLVDYGLPEYDRLRSEIAINRTKRNSFLGADLIYFRSLRDDENNDEVPTIVGDAAYERRLFPKAIGGELRLNALAHAHRRTSDQDILGRDIARFTADANWLRDWILPGGLRVDGRLGFSADVFDINQDSNFASQATRATPRAALAVRLPMTRRMPNGSTHFLEPVVQIAWSNITGDPVPNDESGLVEFDQGNLLSLSRFPAPDRREDGLGLAYGVNWSVFAAKGWQASASVGQVFRKTPDPDFSLSSGLAGKSSDFLVAGQLKIDTQLELTARSLFDDTFSFSKAELRGDWNGKRSRLVGSYLWLPTDPGENRPNRISEIWLDGGYEVTRHWTTTARWRYDLTQSRATTAGIGFVYRNECVEIDLSLNRRNTSSASFSPSTSFGFSIALRGFSAAGEAERYSRTCS